MLPMSGTCCVRETSSLVLNVAPASFAAFARSCSAWARSAISWVLRRRISAARWFLNSVATRSLISSKEGVRAGSILVTSNTTVLCGVWPTCGPDFSLAEKIASINWGWGPMPGSASVRLIGLLVTTCAPYLLAALSSPCFCAMASASVAAWVIMPLIFSCLMASSIAGFTSASGFRCASSLSSVWMM